MKTVAEARLLSPKTIRDLNRRGRRLAQMIYRESEPVSSVVDPGSG